jgi:VWFA-related protein
MSVPTRYAFARAGVFATLGAMAVSAYGGQAGTDTPKPAFKARVTAVELDVTVTDADGRFVRGLTRDDFEVVEDDRRQDVAAFAVVDIPVDPPSPDRLPAASDVRANTQSSGGRAYILVLDALHTPALETTRTQEVARLFVERCLGPHDLMAVVTLGPRSGAHQNFTSDPRPLLEAIDRFRGEWLPPEWVPVPGQNATVELDSVKRERMSNALSMLRKLGTVADWFGAVRGRRKALVFVSKGIDFDVENVLKSGIGKLDGMEGSLITRQAMESVSAISRTDVSIFAIDPSGLDAGPPAAATRMAHNNLRYLAEQTGGFALTDSNNFSGAFDRVVREISSYYALTYYPEEGKGQDRAFHRTRVRVKRPGLTARTRTGYATPQAPLAAPAGSGTGNGLLAGLRDALLSPLPVDRLPLTVFAAPFGGADARTSILLRAELSGDLLQFAPSDRLEVSYAAIDDSGKVRASGTLNGVVHFSDETRARARAAGVGLLHRFELEPGRYQLRVAALDVSSGAVGSVLYDLDAPAFRRERFAMSGLVLTSRSASVQPTFGSDHAFDAYLPAPPSARRSFPPGDELSIFAQIYDRVRDPHQVNIATTLEDAGGEAVFTATETRAPDAAAAGTNVYQYAERVPLEGLAPGMYVLSVSAVSVVGGQTRTIGRRTSVTVVP